MLFNALALVFLIAGVLGVETNRVGLVDERLAGIRQEAQIVASALAEYTAESDQHAIRLDLAEPLLRQLIAPTELRARLYDLDGRLELDTRDLLARNLVEVAPLPALGTWSRTRQLIGRVYNGVMGVRPFRRLSPYFEAGKDGRVYSEVNRALTGETAFAQRVDEQNRLVLSVAVPIQRFKAIDGVLLVSTEGGDIDAILHNERATLIKVFLVALLVMLVSSLYLASVIAEPIRRLAAAADLVRRGRRVRQTIPPMPDRDDEIGALAANLSTMTRALYDRMDAIESFAADVAHELKNPLTSLKSAVEMLGRSETGESRERLIGIVRSDVRRIDRLITDVSDASRLDAELSRERLEPVALRRLLETIVEIYRMVGLPRNQSLELHLPLSGDLIVLGRDERLGQVFRNLIDNAISFSPPDGVVRIRAEDLNDTVQIAVEDEGPGIPPHNREAVFDRFYTERPGEQEFGNNSGLGLSIARQILMGVGGRIWVEDAPTGGARLMVEIPLAKDEQCQ